MTDHLPECLHDDSNAAGRKALCICAELRACEQRSYNEAVDDMASATIRLENKRIRDEGYAAGLDAARDAVAATGIGELDPALAAIDALRGDR